MKLGLQINDFSWSGGPARLGATLAEIAQAAENTGFDRIGVADHLWQHPIMGDRRPTNWSAIRPWRSWPPTPATSSSLPTTWSPRAA